MIKNKIINSSNSTIPIDFINPIFDEFNHYLNLIDIAKKNYNGYTNTYSNLIKEDTKELKKTISYIIFKTISELSEKDNIEKLEEFKIPYNKENLKNHYLEYFEYLKSIKNNNKIIREFKYTPNNYINFYIETFKFLLKEEAISIEDYKLGIFYSISMKTFYKKYITDLLEIYEKI